MPMTALGWAKAAQTNFSVLVSAGNLDFTLSEKNAGVPGRDTVPWNGSGWRTAK